MTYRPASDLSETLRKVEKALLMLRFVWRFPRVKGGWPKYEYLKPWLADLRPATVVDVGVNHGQFLHLARRLWPGAGIVGIEPNAALAGKIAAIYAGDGNVRIENCAVGDRDGEIAFHITDDDQGSSIHEPAAGGDDTEVHSVVRSETVALRRLDGLLAGRPGPMIFKIDVQGAELEVLKGCGDRLGDADVVIVEAPFERAYEGASGFDDIYAFLTARGFGYEGALGQLNSRRTGRVRQEDSIYVRRSA
ncbi:MAG: FkbM family methyltransferase [Rhodospirillaceae bacterium]